MLGGRPNCGLLLCFPLWLHAVGSGFGLYDGSDLGPCLLMGWWGPDLLAHQGLPFGFLLLRCFVLFAVGFMFLLYLLFIS